LIAGIRQRLSKLGFNFTSLGFSSFERRAIWFLVVLLLAGASFRLYRSHSLSRQVSLWVEASADEASDSVAVVKPPTPDNPLNINRATALELELLPGIGPVRSQQIVNHRREHGPFTDIGQLEEVNGIGPVTMQKLKTLVSIGDSVSGQSRYNNR